VSTGQRTVGEQVAGLLEVMADRVTAGDDAGAVAIARAAGGHAVAANVAGFLAKCRRVELAAGGDSAE